MAHFSFTVDTSEMAAALHGVAPHVDGTTAAVVAMQTAVIVAERQAAEQICTNVNRGFFGLIRSQISQRMAAYRSQMDARIMELAHQASELASIKARMERDYQMISARYLKLFKTLDAALFSRVQELDRPLLGFVSRDMDKLRNRAQASQASFPVHQSESLQASQQIASSLVKARTSRAIEGMRRFVGEASQQRSLVSSMLDEGASTGDVQVHLPVAFLEADSTRSAGAQWQFHYPAAQEPLVRRLKASVESRVQDGDAALEWRPPTPEERTLLTRHFQQALQASQVSERARKLMVQMMAASGWQTLGKSRS